MRFIRTTALLFCLFVASSFIGKATQSSAQTTRASVQLQPLTSVRGMAGVKPSAHAHPTPPPSKEDKKKSSEKNASDYVRFILIGFGLVAILWLSIKEWRRGPLVIEPIDVPKDLQEAGITGTVISQLLSDYILELQRSARVEDDPSDIVFVELPRLQVDILLPGTTWSFRGVIRFLKQALGREELRLLGEIIKVKKGYLLRLRSSSGRSQDVAVPFYGASQIDATLKAAAEVAVKLIDPFEAASIQRALENPSTKFQKTLECLKLNLSVTRASLHQDSYVLWASVHRALGEFDLMRAKLRQAEIVGPRQGRARRRKLNGSRYYNFVGSICRDEGQLQEAEAHFKSALRVDPKNLGALNNLGLLYIEQQRFEAAKPLFSRLIKLRPNSSRGYRGLGLIAHASFDLDEAIRLFNRAIDLVPLARWPRINLIQSYRTKGDLASAQESIDDFKSLDPTFAPFLRTWSDVLREVGEIDAAMEKGKEAVSLAPFDRWGYIGLANLLKEKGEYPEALAAVKKGLELSRNMPSAMKTWGDILRFQGNFPGAAAKYREAIEVAPHDPWAYLGMAEILRQQKRYPQAMEFINSTFGNRPFPHALRARGDVLRDQRRFNDAINEYRKANKIAPLDVWTHLGLATTLRLKREFRDAIASLEEAEILRPNLPYVYRVWGEVLQAQNDLSGAVQKYQRAIEVAPYDAFAYLGLANVFMLQLLYPQATAAVEAALKVRPGFSEAYLKWGEILYQSADFPTAVRKYREAIGLAPADPRGYLRLAHVLAQQGEYEEAVASVETALLVRPKMVEALRKWGDILLGQNKIVEAAGKFREAIAAAPLDPWAYLDLSWVLRKQKEYQQANDMVESVLLLSPEISSAIRAKGDILLDQKDLSGAEKMYQHAIDADPVDPWGFYRMGHVLRSKDPNEAIRALQGALSVRPHMPEALREWGNILKARKDAAGAEAKYREAMRVAPADPHAFLDLAKLLMEHDHLDDADALVEDVLRLRPKMTAALSLRKKVSDKRNCSGSS